jgi:hypothetical protein
MFSFYTRNMRPAQRLQFFYIAIMPSLPAGPIIELFQFNIVFRPQAGQGELMKTKIAIPVISVLVVSLLALGLFVPLSTAQATFDTAQKTPAPWRETQVAVHATLAALPTQDFAGLENVLTREKLALSNQKTRLELAHTTAGAVQEYIDSQKSAGKDTSALVSALSTFNQAITDAEKDNAAAGSLLANPAGFDASGHVTDKAAARQTVHTAGQSLRKAHLTMTTSALTLRQAVKTYRGK